MKILLTLFVLLFSTIVSFTSYAGLFDKTICLETDAQFRGGYIYLPNKNKPFSGNILCEYENGQTKIKGEVKDGLLDGELLIWYKNGQKKIEINFRNENGEYVAFLPDNSGLVSSWDKHGRKQSKGDFTISLLDYKFTYYFENNLALWIDFIQDDKLFTSGFITYYDDGKLMSERWTIMGKEWTDISWFKNGQKENETVWSYSPEYPKGISLQKGWYESGNQMFEYKVDHDNNFQGMVTSWHDNSYKQSEYFFKNGEPTDYEKIWDENGKLIISSE